MEINIIYFAAMREAAGRPQEVFQTKANTAEELFSELMSKYNFQLNVKNLKVAINEEYVPFSSPLKSGDTVVFIPPVAGG